MTSQLKARRAFVLRRSGRPAFAEPVTTEEAFYEMVLYPATEVHQ